MSTLNQISDHDHIRDNTCFADNDKVNSITFRVEHKDKQVVL